MTATDLIPLFPLNTVLFPGIPLPLHVFEHRYRALVEDLVAAGGPQRFGVVAIERGLEVGDEEEPVLHDVGCVAEIRHASRFADGRYDLTTTGARRFRLHDVDDSRPYLRGVVEYLPEEAGDGAQVRAVAVLAAFGDYCRAVAEAVGRTVEAPDLPPDDPALVSYVVAAAMVLDLPEKQALLAIPDASTRLRRELSLLRRENALMDAAPDEPRVEGPFSLN